MASKQGLKDTFSIFIITVIGVYNSSAESLWLQAQHMLTDTHSACELFLEHRYRWAGSQSHTLTQSGL